MCTARNCKSGLKHVPTGDQTTTPEQMDRRVLHALAAKVE
jgi:hypothetical protein